MQFSRGRTLCAGATCAAALLLVATAAAARDRAAAPAAPAAKIFWVSEPVSPGQTALVAVATPGTGPNASSSLGAHGGRAGAKSLSLESRQNGTTPPGRWEPLRAIGATEHGVAVTVPASYRVGSFDIRVAGVPDSEHTANAPRPWFLFGDQASFATPGGSVRVVGDAVGLPLPGGGVTAAALFLTPPGGGATVRLTVRPGPGGDGVGAAPTISHAYFDLPSDLPVGSYKASVANDASDAGAPRTALCTFLDPGTPCLATLNVSSPIRWPSARFVVSAQQPGAGRDATHAVQSAVAAAAANGGGVVFFPRGQYFVRGPLVVAPGTVLRGESRELVSIYFAEDNATTAPPAYVTSTVAGPWGAEDLTFYVTAFANDIVQFKPGTHDAFLRRTRIRFNSYFCLEPVEGKGSRGRTTSWSHDVGTAVRLAGTNLFVTDNDIYSSGDVVSTLNNGAAGASYMHIARNRFWNGGTTHWGISWKQSIYEDNVATGVSTTAMGSNYPQYQHSDGAPHVQNIYHHNNSQNMVWGNDREMMTSDAGGGVYVGHVEPQAVGGSSVLTTVTLTSPAAGTQPGGALCVLGGTNAGDCRRVVASNAGPPPPPLKPPQAPTAMVQLVLTPCSLGYALAVESNGSIVPSLAPNLTVCVLCNAPGHPSGSTECGAQPFAEPLVLDVPDSWARQYGTSRFNMTVSGTLVLDKSGKCVQSADAKAGSPVELSACGAAPQRWTHRPDGLLEQLSAGDGAPIGMCVGFGGGGGGGGVGAFEIDAPFSLPLDATSYITVLPFQGHIAFNGNDYSDGGEVQFYSTMLGSQAVSNTFSRTGGLTSWARLGARKGNRTLGWGANFRNSFLWNRVAEGNHVWNYATKPSPDTDPAMWPYFPGGTKTIEPWFFGSLTNDQGPPTDPGGLFDPQLALNRFIVFRGNRVDSNGGLVVRGTSANVLVEGTVVANSDVGVHVNLTTTKGSVVLVNNTEPSGVPANYNPYHKGAAGGRHAGKDGR